MVRQHLEVEVKHGKKGGWGELDLDKIQIAHGLSQR